MALNTARAILNDIKNGNTKPIYCLMGEEPYYIDVISKYIEENVLSEAEKSFNQVVLYGRDVSIEDIVSAAKRYPMMAEKQVVIVKEAQDLSRTIENLTPYAKNPTPSTVLVLCYKYKKLDGRKSLAKAIRKTGVLFESKKLYEDKIPDWIKSVLAAKGYTISVKGAQMLVEFLGTDLGKINNELEKLQLVLKPGEQITPEIIEENIGISKDFNNFELVKALGSRDKKKAFAIIQYFAQNPKDNPMPFTTAILYGFYNKLLTYHALDKKADAAKALKIPPYFLNDYVTAARNIPMRKASEAIAAIREVDLKSKGVGANLSQADLLKELYVALL